MALDMVSLWALKQGVPTAVGAMTIDNFHTPHYAVGYMAHLIQPANIYRAKGLIYAADAPTWRAVLRVVGRRVDIALADEWGERTPRTQIVAIGARGTLDSEALRNMIEQCIGTRTSSHATAPSPSPDMGYCSYRITDRMGRD